MKPTILRQADAETGAADPTTESSKRKQVSKRTYLKADKTEADDMESAAGGCYILLSPSGNIEFPYIFGENPEFDRMCAIFGFHTKVGNVANTVLNDKDEAGTPQDAGNAIAEFITKGKAGTWAERTTGGPGSRVDKAALAGAAVEVAEATGSKAWQAGIAAGKTPDDLRGSMYADLLARLESDPQLVRQVRAIPDVAAAYRTRVGAPAKTLDDLL